MMNLTTELFRWEGYLEGYGGLVGFAGPKYK